MNGPLDLASIRQQLDASQGKEYWRSLEELSDSPDFQEYLHKEFPRQAAPLESAIDRRGFLKFLGASLALAGLTACARPLSAAEKVVPYVRQPEEIVPGRPLFYATAISSSGYAEGVLAESHQGRPTKLEGNPDHPASLGATTATTQASILTLYDPDRSREVLQSGNTATWSGFARVLQASVAASRNGTGVRILSEPVRSPALANLMQRFLATFPEARWYQYDTLGNSGIALGTEAAFGSQLMPVYDFTQADVVVSFDADVISDYPGRLRYARQIADRRRVRNADHDMNRLYVFESSPSTTGAIADHRVPAGQAQLVSLIIEVARSLGVNTGTTPAPAGAGVDPEVVAAMVADLNQNRGRSAVVAGQYLPPQAQALVHSINYALGNVGSTVTYIESPEGQPLEQNPLEELVADMRTGDVGLLLMLGVNPVHTAPAGLNFAGAMDRVNLTMHAGLYNDETARRSDWHAPLTHFLETWGDARAHDGTVSISQPLISPFYGGHSELEIISLALGSPEMTSYQLLTAYWRERVTGTFESFWRQSVYQGVVPGTTSPAVSVQPRFLSGVAAPDRQLTLALRPDPHLADGRWANNGWLQEVPKPFTKLVWDNAALVSAATAQQYGLQNGDLIEITAGDRSLEVPAWILPGQADESITLHTGFGRSGAGRVGSGVGVNASGIMGNNSAWNVPVSIRRTGGKYPLVSTQMHHALEGTGEARHLIRHGTISDFQAEPEHPTFAHPVAHHESDLFPDWEYNSYKWGMVIDQNVCTGCNACVVACQSENNIPIVGKDQVAVGREMHWLRIDNYYAGSIDRPDYYHQPMLCQHCEKAPCEPVCPVGATVHDHEGLNVMVYNRCVGTRYCSNNCPFKVRRFNYLQYAELGNTGTELSLASNPDVTVRSRGVMEKCTYCTQRISAARITAGNEDRRIRDGEVVTACQAACPTQAIVFGDLNDPESQVSQHRLSPLNYTLLDELNVYPRNSYVAVVKNPAGEGAA